MADLDAQPPSSLEDVGLAAFADLYRVLAGVMTPAQADDCELWQLAALLGADRREDSNDLPLIERLPEPGEKIDMTARMMADMGIQTR